MLRILSILLIALFVSACDNHLVEEVDRTHKKDEVSPQNEYVAALTYKSVAYISDKGTPRVEVISDLDSLYVDYGSSECDAHCTFNKFYKPAFHQTGALTYWVVDGMRSINAACYNCTSVDPSK